MMLSMHRGHPSLFAPLFQAEFTSSTKHSFRQGWRSSKRCLPLPSQVKGGYLSNTAKSKPKSNAATKGLPAVIVAAVVIFVLVVVRRLIYERRMDVKLVDVVMDKSFYYISFKPLDKTRQSTATKSSEKCSSIYFAWRIAESINHMFLLHVISPMKHWHILCKILWFANLCKLFSTLSCQFSKYKGF